MATVDLAFAELAAAEGFPDVTYWRLWDRREWLQPGEEPRAEASDHFFDSDTGLTYRNLRGRIDEFLDADAIVFWGDFLHMAEYVEMNADILHRHMRIFDDLDAARDYAERHLLLKGQSDEVLRRVMSYGTTLGFNTTQDYAAEYGPLLRSFLGRAHRAWGRDTYSALIAQLERPDSDETTKGTDAALLLGDRDHRRRDDTLGVFIGRSQLDPAEVARLGRSLTERLALAPKWIEWGTEPAFWPMNNRRRLRLAWPGLEHGARVPTLQERLATYRGVLRGGARAAASQVPAAELVEELSRHRLVLTDTYHLAVNAWRVGTPAICLVDPPSQAGWDVNSGGSLAARDKRTEFYSQIDATPLLVESRRLAGSLNELVGGIAGFLGEPEHLEVVHARIARMRAGGRAQFVGAIRELTGV
ncbi:hypothetical protein GCM10022286_18190 [Gryllotalpicola daejeonensis]|uniref:Polysaccharide pyruvyl transferase domain-containing protein n=1 Tax=Gryllotalpicola daejeonensis TaxID=993087 RepID=A0ABP7ZK67_9MICO